MSTRQILPAAALLAALLAGCAAPPATLDTATASAAPSPAPSPTDDLRVHSDATTGIVFEEAPDLAGVEAEVYDAVAAHQTAFWETLRTNEVSEMLATSASAEVQATMARIAANNAAEDARIGGEFHTSIRDVVVTDDTATAVVCDDLRQATFANNTGELTVEEAGQDVPRRNTLELSRHADGVWHLERIVADGTC